MVSISAILTILLLQLSGCAFQHYASDTTNDFIDIVDKSIESGELFDDATNGALVSDGTDLEGNEQPESIFTMDIKNVEKVPVEDVEPYNFAGPENSGISLDGDNGAVVTEITTAGSSVSSSFYVGTLCAPDSGDAVSFRAKKNVTKLAMPSDSATSTLVGYIVPNSDYANKQVFGNDYKNGVSIAEAQTKLSAWSNVVKKAHKWYCDATAKNAPLILTNLNQYGSRKKEIKNNDITFTCYPLWLQRDDSKFINIGPSYAFPLVSPSEYKDNTVNLALFNAMGLISGNQNFDKVYSNSYKLISANKKADLSASAQAFKQELSKKYSKVEMTTGNNAAISVLLAAKKAKCSTAILLTSSSGVKGVSIKCSSNVSNVENMTQYKTAFQKAYGDENLDVDTGVVADSTVNNMCKELGITCYTITISSKLDKKDIGRLSMCLATSYVETYKESPSGGHQVQKAAGSSN